MTVRPGFRLFLGVLTALLAGCSGGSVALDSASRGAIEATVEPVHGREAIGEFWHQGTDAGLEVSTLRLEVAGNVAYLIGRYRLPPTEQEEADSGQYVLCLKRQTDGTWKLTADIWNGSGASDERGSGGDSPKAAIN